jgi:RimJ/RimL family protein N-acetyltransferase
MKRIVVGEKERISRWVAEKMHRKDWCGDDYEAIGLEKDGVLVGGVVVDGYVKGARCSIHCSGDGRHWLNREFLGVVFRYVFEQLKCNVVVNPVSSANADSLRFTEHIGFTEVCRIEGGYPDGDLVIFKMPKAQCRWLKTGA